MQLKKLIDALREEPHETEWLEFKENNSQPQLIGEYLSALSNSACLCWENKCFMTNSSLRERFGIKESNYPMASKVIKQTIDAGLIKAADPANKSTKKKYIPHWG